MTRNFMDVVRRRLSEDPGLAKQFNEELARLAKNDVEFTSSWDGDSSDVRRQLEEAWNIVYWNPPLPLP